MNLEKSRRTARATVARRLGRNLKELAEESQQGERDFLRHIVSAMTTGFVTGGFAGVLAWSRGRISSTFLSVLIALVLLGVAAVQRLRKTGED